MAGLNDFVVFNDFAQASFTEEIDQLIELWNGATRNALMLSSAANIGDYMEQSSYALLADLVGNRNAYGTGALTAVDLAQLLNISVKVGGGSDPVTYTGTSFDWTQRPSQEAGVVFGKQVARGAMHYKLNTAISALVASITAADVTYDGTAGVASIASLNLGAGKLGDRQNSIAAWIMHSKSITDIYGGAISNSNRLFEFDNINVTQDGFGRPLIMTDSDALHFDNTGTENYHQLGLVSGACAVEDNGDFKTYQETQVERENAREIVKSEFSFNIGIKGATWDKAAGGASPNDAALALSTNWDRSATSHKDTAGVKVTTL
ncbi:MAG TPA: hypothetical protein EYN67_01465 [Flavobacteriales bacterium]|nr:hypothetical protein [Flavobacteriales bacterium]